MAGPRPQRGSLSSLQRIHGRTPLRWGRSRVVVEYGVSYFCSCTIRVNRRSKMRREIACGLDCYHIISAVSVTTFIHVTFDPAINIPWNLSERRNRTQMDHQLWKMFSAPGLLVHRRLVRHVSVTISLVSAGRQSVDGWADGMERIHPATKTFDGVGSDRSCVVSPEDDRLLPANSTTTARQGRR